MSDTLEKKNAMMKMHEGRACEDLWTAVQTIPFQLSASLQEAGPIARIQMLFNIANRKYSDLKDHTTCMAQQMNKNLSYLDSLEHLETVYTGLEGAWFFENIYKFLPKKQLHW